MCLLRFAQTVFENVGRKLLKTVQAMTTLFSRGPPGNPSRTPFGPRTRLKTAALMLA